MNGGHYCDPGRQGQFSFYGPETLYKIQPTQFRIVLLHLDNKGTEPQTIYWAAILGGPTA